MQELQVYGKRARISKSTSRMFLFGVMCFSTLVSFLHCSGLV